MKIALIVVLLSSQYVFASMECEKNFSDHFKTLQFNVKKSFKSNDYLNADFEAIGKKLNNTDSKIEFQKLLESAKKFETADSRFNEIVRVCSSIRAFAEVGMSADEIESKTLSYQNGWSEGMRSPLKSAIKQEIKQLRANNEIVDLCTPKSKNSKRVNGAQ